ncbi:zinc finger and BTB domain-containing protein 17-like [Bacillus rossius redtenbacheri]|uniref:zinc finger and BTB domain-containing protein 17-like n=1 Tax=Bacillus rossius redtenbacheri TaxID=93214 RepID=UPI002FDE069E
MAETTDSSVVEIVCEAHFARLTSALKELATAGVLTDITFVCEDGTLQAHQVVVSAFSSSLRQVGGRRSCVLVTGARKPAVQALLHLLYLGHARVGAHELEAVAQAAAALGLDCFARTRVEPAGDEVRLSFPDHERCLRESLQRARSGAALCDVVFVTAEFAQVHAHACVVATCSDVLRDVLAGRRRDDGPCVLVLEGTELRHLSPILDLCYRGDVLLAQGTIGETHATARLLGADYVCEILGAAEPTLGVAATAEEAEPRAAGTVRLQDGRDGCRGFRRLLAHLAGTESLADVTLLRSGRCLRAHSVLLCAFGPYFKQLEGRLGHQLKEAVVLVRSLTAGQLQACLDYLYRGEARFSGGPRQFCSLLSHWIDFSLLPAEEASLLPCRGVSVEKTCEALGLSLDNISCVVELSEEFNLGRDAVLLQDDGETAELTPAAETQECKKTEERESRWVELKALKVEAGGGDPRARSPAKAATKVCSLCKEEFTSLAEFSRHLASHPESKWVTCEHCSQAFATAGELRVHMRSHAELRPFPCGVCGKRFATRCVLRKHGRAHDGDPAKAHRCPVCSKSFQRREYYAEHMRTHTGTKPFECPTCGKAFVGRTGLNHHVKTHADPDARRNCACEVCGKHFTRHALWAHVRTHEKPARRKAHACGTCGQACGTASALRTHVLRAHESRPEHGCHVCGRRFGRQRDLLRHARSHERDKESRHPTEAQLGRHTLLSHEAPGDLPFSCGVCRKSFADRSSLANHLRSHTGEQLHTCRSCGKTFCRPHAFKKHEDSCGGAGPRHKCPCCEETFLNVAARNKHVASCHEMDAASDGKDFSGSEPFRCAVCRTSFLYQESLENHAEVHAGGGSAEAPVVPDHGYAGETAVDDPAGALREQSQEAGVKTRQPFMITIDGNLTYDPSNKVPDGIFEVMSQSAAASVQDLNTSWSLSE